MIRLWISLMVAIVACCSVRASEIPFQQSGSVEIRSDSVLVDQQSSTDLTPLELQVGDTFNEAELRIQYVPNSVPLQGFDGSTYISAISMPGEGDRFSQVIFHYDFRLDSPADYTMRYNKQGDADTMLVVANASEELISLVDSQNLFLHGRFDPGDYRFSIEGAAFSSFISSGMVAQDYSQIDFALLLTPVPEPSSIALALAATCLLLRLDFGRG